MGYFGIEFGHRNDIFLGLVSRAMRNFVADRFGISYGFQRHKKTMVFPNRVYIDGGDFGCGYKVDLRDE